MHQGRIIIGRTKWRHFRAIHPRLTETGKSEVGHCARCDPDAPNRCIKVDLRRVKSSPALCKNRIHQAMERHDAKHHSLVAPAPARVNLGDAKRQAQDEVRRSKAAAAKDKRLQQEATKEAKKRRAIGKAVAVLLPHWTLESLHADGLEQIRKEFCKRTRIGQNGTQARPSPSPSPMRGGALPEPEPDPAEQVEVEGADSDDSHNDS